MMISFVVLLLVLSANRALTLHESWFERGQICDVEERLNRGCSTEKSGVHDMAKCVVTCGGDISCIGASLDATGNCFHHQLCVSTMACTQPNPEHDYMARFCVHGTWDSATQSCKCVMGCFGTRCDNYPRNCSLLLEANYPNGRHFVFIDPLLDGTKIINVLCTIGSPNFHSITMYSNTGKLDFNRPFDEYENGFRADDRNLWLGLKPLHILSQAGCNRFYIVLEIGWHNSVYRTHERFNVAGKESGYSISYSSTFHYVIGNAPPGYFAGNCLVGLQNKPFSTWDNDRDGDSQTNCASQAGSGWWYSGCNNPCNVLGWGLEDYANTPTHQRLSMFGVNVGASPVPITNSRGIIHC